MSAPAWTDHAVWWHVYPLGFLDGRPLRTLTDWLDHLIGLGANGLALGPIFTSETHGYDTVDHYTIDPRLGTDDDLDRLVDTAGARGVRILLDGVFNHVGRGFPRFADVAARGEASPWAGWFRRAGRDWQVFEGHHRLVTLDHDNPDVAAYVTDVMNHWLDRGIAGWRLDAAYAVPSTFWAGVGAAVKSAHPDSWLVGEVIHGDYRSYATDAGLDSVTQYELWKAIWSAFNDRNLFELAWALGRHDTLPDTLVPMTFLGNHDVTRIASALNERRLLPHALVVLCTVAGIPSVYYGDEYGLTGVKEAIRGSYAPAPSSPR
jgi:glycosidase